MKCKPRDKYGVFFPTSITFEGTALFEVLNFSSDFCFLNQRNALSLVLITVWS